MIQPITLSIELALAAIALSFLVAIVVGQYIAAGNGRGALFPPETTLRLASAREQSRPGEFYAGSSVDPVTERVTHLYVLPGLAETGWKDASDWAHERNAMLPSIDELPRIIEALGDVAKPGRYWSRERSIDDPKWAFVYDSITETIDDERVEVELFAVVVRHAVV